MFLGREGFVTDVRNVTFNFNRGGEDFIRERGNTIYIRGGPRARQGYRGVALDFTGTQYLETQQDLICGGNVATCPRGFTVKMFIRPRRLRDNTYIISSGPFSLYYKNNRLYADVRSSARKWVASTPRFRSNTWYDIEITWDNENGVSIFIGGQRVAQQARSSFNDQPYGRDYKLYVGRANTDMINENYFRGQIENLQFYAAKRDIVISTANVTKISELCSKT